MLIFGYCKIKTLLQVPVPIAIGIEIRKEGCFNVRMEGLEPPCLAALDPKSSASTNFATSAYFFIALFEASKKLERKFREYFLLSKVVERI